MTNNFEGPEKNFMLYFSSKDKVKGSDLRLITRKELDFVLLQAKCTILDKISTDLVDSYILSESSLFVYKDNIGIKTCGTTALILCLEPLISLARQLKMELVNVCYFRMNFEFPEEQIYPHQSFQQEVDLLSNTMNKEGLKYTSTTLGNTENKCFVFYASRSSKSKVCLKNHYYILMYDLSENKCKNYFGTDESKSLREISIKKQIESVSTVVKKHDFVFKPCGYSLNALYKDGISTIHVTPEKECSYASFETNCTLSQKDLKTMVSDVTKAYQPGRISLVSLTRKKVSNVSSFPKLYKHNNIELFEEELKVGDECLLIEFGSINENENNI